MPRPAPLTDHRPPSRSAPRIEAMLAIARLAQSRWATTPVRQRLVVLRRFRHLLADRPEQLANTVRRPAAETLTSQIIPLADHARFLERHAADALRERHLGRSGRPVWLWGTSTRIVREPVGVVLIIAPANYPLFIPGTQLLQALAAGNAVLLKPSPAGRSAALALTRLLAEAGLDPDLVTVLPSDTDTAIAAIRAGPDRILLTGSSDTGRAVVAASAERLIPCTLELSGSDPVLVRADADLPRLVRALQFGLSLNHGATCIAPRRVLIHRSILSRFEGLLRDQLMTMPSIPIVATQAEKIRPLLIQALQLGAIPLWPSNVDWARPAGPIVVSSATPSMPLLQADLFAPVLAVVPVNDDDEAIAAAAECPFGLGASIFSADEATARSLASRVRAGVVTINDIIVPTADPRVPFGGHGASGYGVTRGIEGLQELTRLKVVAARRGTWLPHLETPAEGDAEFFAATLGASHAGSPWQRALSGLRAARLAWRRRTPSRNASNPSPAIRTQTHASPSSPAAGPDSDSNSSLSPTLSVHESQL